METSTYHTVFASLRNYERGHIEIIDDRPENYALSNVFDVAAHSAPYEKTVVGKNLKYVIEVLRAEGRSDWFSAAHDEFALLMDGELRIDLIKLDTKPAGVEGSIKHAAPPAGRAMGWMKLGRGHQALLPHGAAYRFDATAAPSVIVLQTILGPNSVEKWPDICSR